MKGASSGAPFIALASARDAMAYDGDLPLLAEAFARAGLDHEVHPWDAAVDWSRYDGVVVRSTWDYTERRDEFLAWVESVPRLANPASVIRWNTDKRYLATLGVPVVPTVWPRDGESIPQQWSDIVVKPTVSAGGRFTGRFTSADAATEFAHQLLTAGHDVMAQQYVASVDVVGEAGVFFFGGKVSHAIRKGAILDRDAPPRSDSSLGQGQASEPLPLDEAPVAFARAVLDAIGQDVLYGRVDSVLDDDGNRRVLEVELVEPYLFLSLAPGAAERFVTAVIDWLGTP